MKLQSLSIALILFSLGQIAFGQGESTPPADPQAIGVTEDPVLLPYSEEEFTELKAAMSSGDQKAVEAITRRHDERERNHRRDRRKPVEPLPDNPIPDQNEGEGESVSPAETEMTDEEFNALGDKLNRDFRETGKFSEEDTVRWAAEELRRDKRRRERLEKQREKEAQKEKERKEKEQRQREQEEYDRLHPKPQKPGLLGWIWSWTLGPILSVLFWPFAWIFTLIKWGGILALLTIALCMLAFGILCGSVSVQVIRWMWNRTAEIIASFKKPKVEPQRYSNDPEPTGENRIPKIKAEELERRMREEKPEPWTDQDKVAK